jgi:hypothetical protein
MISPMMISPWVSTCEPRPPEAGQARPSPKKAKGSPRFVHDSARPQPEPSVESQATAIDLQARRSAADE